MNLLEKWILGLSGARDEAQQKAISSIGLQGYIVTYLVGCIALIISFGWDLYTGNLNIRTILIAGIVIIPAMFMMYRLRKSGSDQTEVYSETDYRRLITHIKWQVGLSVVNFSVVMSLVMTYGYTWLLHDKENYFFNVLDAITCGLVWGVCMYFYAKHKVVKEY